MSLQINVQKVTPEIAQEWLAKLQYEHQRPVSHSHVNAIARSISEGSFPDGTQIRIDHSVSSDRRYLVDGTHRLSAVVKAGIPIECVIVTNQVLNDDAVNRDYYKLDIGRKRTPADAYRAVELDARTGLTRTQLDSLGAAVEMIARGLSKSAFKGITGNKLSIDERLLLMEKWAPTMKTYAGLTSGCQQPMAHKLGRASTLSIALVSLSEYEDKQFANEFWRQVARDDGLRSGDPRKLLHDWLLSDSQPRDTGSISRRRAPYYVACAWNIAVSNKTTPFLRVTKTDVAKPYPILGTSYQIS